MFLGAGDGSPGVLGFPLHPSPSPKKQISPVSTQLMPGPPGGWWFSIRSVFAPQGDIQQYLEIFFKVFFFFFF